MVFDPPSSPIIPSFYPPAEPTPRPSLHPSHHSSLRSLDAVTKESSPSDKKRLAGQRSREKKRNYVKDLEEDVRRLSQEIDQYDAEVSKCKSKLVEALKTTNSVPLPTTRLPMSTPTPLKNSSGQPYQKTPTLTALTFLLTSLGYLHQYLEPHWCHWDRKAD